MGANTDIVRQWFEEVWNRGRAEAIEELLAPDAVMHGLGPEGLRGSQAFRQFHAAFCATYSDICVTVERTVEEGEMVSAWCRATAVHRQSGTAVAFSGAVLGEVRGGRIQAGWNNWDFLGLLTQLGAVDAEAAAQLLGAGEAVEESFGA